jgi:hypothetical protein
LSLKLDCVLVFLLRIEKSGFFLPFSGLMFSSSKGMMKMGGKGI